MNPTSNVVASLSGAVKRYGSLTALDGVDLVLHRGELLANRAVGDGESAEALRSFYFQTTGEIDETLVIGNKFLP